MPIAYLLSEGPSYVAPGLPSDAGSVVGQNIRSFERHVLCSAVTYRPHATTFAAIPAGATAVAIAIADHTGRILRFVTNYTGLPVSGPAMLTVAWALEEQECLSQAGS